MPPDPPRNRGNGSPLRDGSHHHGPAASRRKRGWTRADQTARARKNARSPRWRAGALREHPKVLPARHMGDSPGWEARRTGQRVAWFSSRALLLVPGFDDRLAKDLAVLQLQRSRTENPGTVGIFARLVVRYAPLADDLILYVMGHRPPANVAQHLGDLLLTAQHLG